MVRPKCSPQAYSLVMVKIGDKLIGATQDELNIALTFISKLMGEGRSEHGALDLSDDGRNLMVEACDELDDAISYMLMHRRKMEKLK